MNNPETQSTPGTFQWLKFFKLLMIMWQSMTLSNTCPIWISALRKSLIALMKGKLKKYLISTLLEFCPFREVSSDLKRPCKQRRNAVLLHTTTPYIQAAELSTCWFHVEIRIHYLTWQMRGVKPMEVWYHTKQKTDSEVKRCIRESSCWTGSQLSTVCILLNSGVI